mmetsp:Transcript_35148/g.76220  ORF Transcript_35148/g.76220 Transcript_35148/m.76220 type:complete len:1099 (+) Transcript_35148:367-3663(+)
MPRQMLMRHPVTPTTRASTRSSSRVQRVVTADTTDHPSAAVTAPAAETPSPSSVGRDDHHPQLRQQQREGEDHHRQTQHQTRQRQHVTPPAAVSFATPDRADGVSVGGGGGAGDSPPGSGSSGSGGSPGRRSTRSSSSHSSPPSVSVSAMPTLRTTPDSSSSSAASAAGAPKTVTVTPPEDKTGGGPSVTGGGGSGGSVGGSVAASDAAAAVGSSALLGDAKNEGEDPSPSSTTTASSSPKGVNLQPRLNKSPTKPAVAASASASATASATFQEKEEASHPGPPGSDEEEEGGLSPGAKRFGLRKRRTPRSPPSPTGSGKPPAQQSSASAVSAVSASASASTSDVPPPRSPRASPRPTPASATAARNVTFSPVPPQVHDTARGTSGGSINSSSGGNGNSSNSNSNRRPPARSPRRKFEQLPNLAEHEPLTPSSMFLSPDSPVKAKGGPAAGSSAEAEDKSATAERSGGAAAGGSSGGKGGADGRVATPTNFATDFGKTLQSPSFQNGEGVFSWLQSPTGIFSPGGYISSTMNTPGGYYGATPRTPRTPNDRAAGFFFSDVAGLTPGGEAFSPRRRQPQHPLSNLICVSPLATHKTKPGTPIDYSNVFDSPPGRHPGGGRGAPYIGGKSGGSGKRKKKEAVPTLEAVHMAERELMEDEDLSVLLQLASTATPRGHGRYGAVPGEAPSNLQLPVIGKGGPQQGSSPSKLVARKDMPGGRRPRQHHADEFRPPALPSRASGGHPNTVAAGGVAAGSKTGTAAATTTKGTKASGGPSSSNSARGKKTPSPTEDGAPKKQAPGPPMHPGAPGAEHMKNYPNMPLPPGAYPHYMHPMGPGWKPGTGPPPPHGRPTGPPRGPPPYHMPPPGAGPNVGKGGPPPRPMYHNFPPHGMPYPMMHFPPQPHPRHPINLYGQSKPKSGGGGGGGGTNAPSKVPAKPKDSKPKPAPKRKSTAGGLLGPVPVKKPKPSSPSRKKKRKSGGQETSGAGLSPTDRQKSAKAIQAVNASAGGKNDKAAALAAAILRGVTMRPSGKWQAQLYFAGKSRYIGVFDTREKAALAYEIAREKLKHAKNSASSPKATEDAVNAARKAAFDGVNEKDPRRK